MAEQNGVNLPIEFDSLNMKLNKNIQHVKFKVQFSMIKMSHSLRNKYLVRPKPGVALRFDVGVLKDINAAVVIPPAGKGY